MTNRNFPGITAFSNFSSPLQEVATPDSFGMASATVTPQTSASASNGYTSTDTVVMDAWRRYETTKRSDEQKDALIEVCQGHGT
jgi:hypothetical protein